jgi:hypothetical protein
MTEKTLTTVRRGFRFTWHGGEYIDVSGHKTGGPFEVINVSGPGGAIPEFTLSNFEAQLLGVDYAYLRQAAHEHRIGMK